MMVLVSTPPGNPRVWTGRYKYFPRTESRSPESLSKRGIRLLSLLGFTVFAACATPAPPSETMAEAACASAIHAFGSRAGLLTDPGRVAVSLSEVPVSETTIGYGPGSDYLAELTLIDGVWQIARATGPKSAVNTATPGEGAGAMFLVTASPEAWTTRTLETPVNGMAALEALLAQAASSYGCPGEAIPFKLSGTLMGGEWSVVGRPAGATGRIEQADVTLIGIFDPADPDRYFMPQGRKIHVHVVSNDRHLSGHLNDFEALTSPSLALPQ